MLTIITTFAQRPDPLWNDYNNSELHDTLRFKALSEYIWKNYLFNNTDSALVFIDLLENKAREKNRMYYVLEALNRRGIAYAVKGQSRVSVSTFNEALKEAESIPQERWVLSLIANIHNNLGNVFSGMGDDKNAVGSYEKSLKVMESLDNKAGIGNALHNIAVIFSNQSDYKTSLEYYTRARENHLLAGNRIGHANGAQNIGTLYNKMYDRDLDKNLLDSAVIYLDSSVFYFKELNQKLGLANAYSGLGSNYRRRGKLQKAIDYMDLSLALFFEINDASNIAVISSNISDLYTDLGNTTEALKYANQAIQYAEKSDLWSARKAAKLSMLQILKSKGQYKEALEVYEELTQLNDSLVNEELKNEVIRHKFEYQYERMKLKDSLEMAEEREVSEQRIRLQQVEIENARVKSFGLYAVILVVLLGALFIVNRLKISQKQRKIIEKQKREVEFQKLIVEGKNKEIVDSINYSKRLQEVILPKLNRFSKITEEFFVMYQPKDIVSGDFYWLEETSDAFFIAAADCTGHGVPGAMVSFVCSSALSKVVREEHIYDPGEILNRTREIVVGYFGRSEESIHDGMDLSLIKICKKKEEGNTKVVFAGANNPLWLFREGKIIKYKGNKQPIGSTRNPLPFEEYNIEIFPHDEFYLFTDGYVDQFGGPSNNELGKKMKAIKIEGILSETSKMSEKEKVLKNFFMEWKGKREQTDDVLIIGLKF